MTRHVLHTGPARARIKDQDVKDFAKLMRALDRLIARVRAYEPEANLYVEDSGNMVLLTGDSHTIGNDAVMRARHDRVACTITVRNCGGGGW